MSTYNPRDNSPIKKQEVKMCPTCNQVIQEPVKPLEHVMNEYVNPATGVVVAVLNSKDESFTMQGIKLVRKDKYVPTPTKAPEVPKAPTTAATTMQMPSVPTTPPTTVLTKA